MNSEKFMGKPNFPPHSPHDESVPPPHYLVTGQLMLIAVLISSVVLLLFFIVYSYLRHRHRRRQLADWRRQSRLLFSNRAELSPSRLDQNVINTIPVTRFSLHGDKETESCAVCISEFIEGEKIRVLPQCRHLFHLECIDMWFMSHSTCPLCRADVKSAATSENKELDGNENKEVLHAHSAEEVARYPETNNYSRDGARVHQSPFDMV